MLVTDVDTQYLLCHDNHIRKLLEAGLYASCIVKQSNIWVFGLSEIADRVGKAVENSKSLQVFRYLDRFHLVLSSTNLAERQEVLDEFFEFIAEDYEHLIDLSRNRENIKILLSLLKGRIECSENAIVIDYGCGIGLSNELLFDAKFNLIGFDRCKIMRQIAKDRGMVIWCHEELAKQPDETINGAFASYVLHYLLPENKELQLLWPKLKPGAVLVANLHKKQGIERLEAAIRKVKGSLELLEGPPDSERHGIYVACVK